MTNRNPATESPNPIEWHGERGIGRLMGEVDSLIETQIIMENLMLKETKTIETATGAKSSAGAPRYTLLSYPALLGLIHHLENGTTGMGGAARYGEGNWEKGGRDFLQDRLHHMLDHIFEFLNTPGMTEEEMKVHWRGVGCNWMFIMHFIETGTIPKDLTYKWEMTKDGNSNDVTT